jgi:hypothetical protein
MAVAQPQPATPIAGIGPQPNTSTAFSGTLAARPVSCMAMTALGRLTAVEKPRKDVNSSAAGSAKASGRV